MTDDLSPSVDLPHPDDPRSPDDQAIGQPNTHTELAPIAVPVEGGDTQVTAALRMLPIPLSIRAIADDRMHERAADAWRLAHCLLQIISRWGEWLRYLERTSDPNPRLLRSMKFLAKTTNACLIALHRLDLDAPSFREGGDESLVALVSLFPPPPNAVANPQWADDGEYRRMVRDRLGAGAMLELRYELEMLVYLLLMAPLRAFVERSVDVMIDTKDRGVPASNAGTSLLLDEPERTDQSLTNLEATTAPAPTQTDPSPLKHTIPAERRTRPLQIGRAAKLMGFEGANRAAGRALRRKMDAGRYAFEEIDRQNIIFDINDFPSLARDKVKPPT